MARKSAAGPASDPELLILSSLAGGPKHGYAIMLDIRAFAGVELGPGTLYSAITRLVESGWMEPEKVQGRQRPYRITPGGLRHLEHQLQMMPHPGECRAEEVANRMKRKAIRALLRLYPAAWRAEYGEEFGYLLWVHPLTASALTDVALSAAREHLRCGPVWKRFGTAIFVWTCLGVLINNTAPRYREYSAWYEHLWELFVLLVGFWTALREPDASPARAAAKAALLGYVPEVIVLAFWSAGLFHPLVTKAAGPFPLLESRLALFDMTFPSTPQPGFAMIPFGLVLVLFRACAIGFLGGLLARCVSFLSRQFRRQ